MLVVCLKTLYPNLTNPRHRSDRSSQWKSGGRFRRGYWVKFRKQQCKSWMLYDLWWNRRQWDSDSSKVRIAPPAWNSSDLIKHLIPGGLWRPYSAFWWSRPHHHQCSSWRTWSSKIPPQTLTGCAADFLQQGRQRFTKRCLNEDVCFSLCYPECSPKMLPNLI